MCQRRHGLFGFLGISLFWTRSSFTFLACRCIFSILHIDPSLATLSCWDSSMRVVAGISLAVLTSAASSDFVLSDKRITLLLGYRRKFPSYAHWGEQWRRMPQGENLQIWHRTSPEKRGLWPSRSIVWWFRDLRREIQSMSVNWNSFSKVFSKVCSLQKEGTPATTYAGGQCSGLWRFECTICFRPLVIPYWGFWARALCKYASGCSSRALGSHWTAGCIFPIQGSQNQLLHPLAWLSQCKLFVYTN